LRVAFLEGNGSWLPFWLWRLHERRENRYGNPALKLRPSEYGDGALPEASDRRGEQAPHPLGQLHAALPDRPAITAREERPDVYALDAPERPYGPIAHHF
jgi:hypothetical protein